MLTTDADLLKEPGGTQLLHVAAGTSVLVGPVKGNSVQAKLEGWVLGAAIKDDKRDGFDVSVNRSVGIAIREKPGAGATLAMARFGALFDRIEARDGWVHVSRTGWIPRAALQPPAPPPPAGPPLQATKPSTVQAPAAAAKPAPSVASSSLLGGSTLFAQPGGSPLGVFEPPVKVDVLERRPGWTHIKVDAWVRESSLGEAPAPGGITAAMIRAAPDRYVGQTVEWTLQVLAIQKADELRPELPEGQPYILARGPLPETGFVYVAIPAAEIEHFNALEPLAKIKVRATVRAGHSRFLPTPVLNFVRRLD